MKCVKVYIILICLSIQAYSAPPLNFERDILPVFEKSCFKCHSAITKKPKAGLRMDLKEELLKHKGLIVPGKPEKSSLYELIALPAGHDDVMPPENKAPALSDKDKELVKTWVQQGAHFGNWTEFKDKSVKKTISGLREQEGENVKFSDAIQTIDKLIFKSLSKNKLKMNPDVDQYTFVRRTYLSIVGRIPTLNEILEFNRSKDKNKKAELIRSLLKSPGRVSNDFNYWSNVLRLKSGQEGSVNGSWTKYIKNVLAENKPYDEWVKEMVGAEGSVFTNPEVGFYGRDKRNKAAGYEALVGVFLGKQIGCAQCHDHPYDTTTRRDYHAMFGYIHSIHHYLPKNSRFTKLKGEEINNQRSELNDLIKKSKLNKVKEKVFTDFCEATTNNHMTSYLTNQSLDNVWSKKRRFAKYWKNQFPHDYQYEDGKPKGKLPIDVIFGVKPDHSKYANEHLAFADWISSVDNLRFTHVITNRLWNKVMGTTLMGAVTDLKEETAWKETELIDYLNKLMVSLDYNIVKFQEILYNTRLFQSMPLKVDQMKLAESFVGYKPQRMTAEQVWDSLMTMLHGNIDKEIDLKKPNFDYYIKVMNAKTYKEYWDLIVAKADAEPYFKARNKKYSMMRTLNKTGFSEDHLKRSSELRQPTYPGHFLQLFGQAERETVEDQWTNPTIPQSLSLLNSPLVYKIIGSDSKLQKELERFKSTDHKITALFLAILGRDAGQDEIYQLKKSLTENGQVDLTSVAWVLVNSKQFMFVR